MNDDQLNHRDATPGEDASGSRTADERAAARPIRRRSVLAGMAAAAAVFTGAGRSRPAAAERRTAADSDEPAGPPDHFWIGHSFPKT